jgi:two-component system alkaline phosphatase synthesis response regulator PhoP
MNTEKRVLCVDDDPATLRALSRLLTRRGYRVAPCRDARQAIEALGRDRPDLAILDIMMPGMDGLELTGRIREAPQGPIPVVLLSALDSDEAFYEGHCRGACFYMTKPWEPSRMLDVVDYLIGDLDDSERARLKERL